ncbi:MAG TPA: tetratricopeptide repeat protein [Gemmatimonadales bacterium]|nr:tetratricopeptide repeat protein [Gemmatimonadales bacterium]
MTRLMAWAPLVLLGFVAGRVQDDGLAARRRVRALAESGHLSEAEDAARRGGAAVLVPLGEVLALTGRLAAADSVFRIAVERSVPDWRNAEASRAELAARRGSAGAARQLALSLATAYERDGARWTADDRVAAGRAYVVLGRDDALGLRNALRAFDAAVAADSSLVEARIRLGDLFLDKYNAPDARTSYTEALRLSPRQPRALLGMARVLAFQGSPDATQGVRASLSANPSLAPAQALLAQLHLDAEQYDSAAASAGRALAADSSAADAWAMLGATAWLRDDSAGFARARAGAARVNPRPSDFYSEVAEAVARHRRYAEAEQFGREAVALDSLSSRALGGLGINELRLGHIEAGSAHLTRAFARDPFHIWYKNTLDLLDEMKTFRTVATRRFRIVAPAAEADLLALYLGPLLEEAYDSLAARYEYRPPTPIRIELYRRHADFSVRTVGLAGLGALGVSFGTVLVMDAPSARSPGEFNWGSTAWHELTHTFTLGRSAHRVPRWFSEGLSVLEERRARPAWGAGPTPEFLAAFKAGRLLPLTRLNDGFVRPSYPAELGFSYYQASLVCEMIEGRWGRAALVSMLAGYRDGLDTRGVFTGVLHQTPEALAVLFDAWLRQKFAGPLTHVAAWDGKGPATGEFVTALASAETLVEQKHPAEARAAFERAEAMFPMYIGPDAPALGLARLALERNDKPAAVAALARFTALDESALEANRREASLRQDLGDWAGAAAALQRTLWIFPYDPAAHARLAEVAERLSDPARALRERRAVVALAPADLLEARYQLARALALAGDSAAARHEVLQVLEGAPGFEKAQTLLLDLRKKPEGRVP